MKCFFVSDLHVDFYAPLSRTPSLLRHYFQYFFERNFLPADICCIAGDISNNYFTYVAFLKFIAEKYGQVYVCLGNHDIIYERRSDFGADRDFPTSEEKIAYFLREAAKIPNLHLLENAIAPMPLEGGAGTCSPEGSLPVSGSNSSADSPRVLNGASIAGCLGICDFSYRHSPDATAANYKYIWRSRWFDGRHWNYKGNDPDALWEHYSGVMMNLTAARPKVMMTHFLPLEFDMAQRYRDDPCSAYFYFQGDPFLKNLDEGSIWQAGHTHCAIRKVVRDSLGKSHLLLCNPVGYPNEYPYEEFGLSREDFLLEI